MNQKKADVISNIFFKQMTLMGGIFSLAAAICSAIGGAWLFSAGVLVGTAWIYLNSYFLFCLVEMGANADKKKVGNKIFLISVLKFPVLYVVGFFILKSRVFPLAGILTGLSLYFTAFFITWLRVNLSGATPKTQVKSL